MTAITFAGERFLPEPRNTRGWPRNTRELEWALMIVRDGISRWGATKRIGVSEPTGTALYKRLLPFITHLQEKKNALAERAFDATVERVLREVSAIALADRVSYVRPVIIGGVRRFIGRPPDELTPMQRVAVLSWEEVVVKTDDEGEQVDFRYTLHDKQPAMSFLGKHLGMLSEKVLVEMMAKRSAANVQDYTHVPTEQLEEAIEQLTAIKERLKDSRAIESTAVVVASKD